MSFKDAIALITGGSSGLGWATALRIAQAGGYAVILDLPKSDPTDKIAGLNLQDRISFSPGDVTSVADVQTAIEFTVAKHGRVDLGVSCAGIFLALSTHKEDMAADEKLRVLTKMTSINTGGSFNFLSQAVTKNVEIVHV